MKKLVKINFFDCTQIFAHVLFYYFTSFFFFAQPPLSFSNGLQLKHGPRNSKIFILWMHRNTPNNRPQSLWRPYKWIWKLDIELFFFLPESPKLLSSSVFSCSWGKTAFSNDGGAVVVELMDTVGNFYKKYFNTSSFLFSFFSF